MMFLAPASRYALAALQKGVDGLWRLLRAIAETGRAAGASGNRAPAESLPEPILAAHPVEAAVKGLRTAEDRVQAAPLAVRA